MALSYAQMTEPGSQDFETLRAANAAELIQLLEALKFRATSWQTTSIPFALVMLGAHLFTKGQQFAAFVAKQPYLGQVAGELLALLAQSHFQRTRRESAAAQFRETFTTAAGEGPHSINVGDLVVSDGEHTYRNVDGLGVIYPVSLTSAVPVTLLVEAEEPGSDSNVADNTITTMVTTKAGVTCTNDADPATGTSVITIGADEEDDATLETACETQWGNLTIQTVQAGTVSALINSAPGIAKAKVDDSNPRGAGTLDGYIAGAASVAGGSDVTAAQAALNARFFDNGGSPPRAQALASAAAVLAPTGTVYFDANYSAADVQNAVEAAILAYLKTAPIGGFNFSPGPSNIVRMDDLGTVIKETELSGGSPVKTVDVTSADLTVGTFDVVVPPAVYALVYVPVST